MDVKPKWAAVAVATLLATGATAQPFDRWTEVNNWNIIINEATKGCFMEHQTPEGYVLHIGTTDAMFGRDSSERNYFLGFYAPVDSGFAESNDTSVSFESGPDRFVGTAHEITREGYHGWSVDTNNDNLVDDLNNRNTMTVKAEGGGEALINLFELGIAEAFAEMQECQLMRG